MIDWMREEGASDASAEAGRGSSAMEIFHSSVNCLASSAGEKKSEKWLNNACQKPSMNSDVGFRENTLVSAGHLKEEPARRG